MALPFDTVFEINVEASLACYGGGFSAVIASATGLDYSQTLTAVGTCSDAYIVAGETTLLTVTPIFTTTMLGNTLYWATGTGGYNVSWYMINAVASATMCVVDRAIASTTAATGTIYIGGAVKYPSSDLLLSAMTGGNKAWMKNGTYNLTSWTSLPANPVFSLTGFGYLHGYNTDRGDVPIGDNRPYIKTPTALIFNNCWDIRHIRIESSSSVVFGVIQGSLAAITVNIKAVQKYSYAAIATRAVGVLCYGWEVTAASQGCCNWGQSGGQSQFINGHYHHCGNGVQGDYTGNAVIAINNVFSECYDFACAMKGASSSFMNNTIYNTTSLSTLAGLMVMRTQNSVFGNIITGYPIGICTISGPAQFFEAFNNIYANSLSIFFSETAMASFVNTLSAYSTASISTFVSPSTNDFNLLSGSAALDALQTPLSMLMLTVTASYNMGAFQNDNVVSAGSSVASEPEKIFVYAGG